MNKQTEALKLALEALNRGESHLRWEAIAAIEAVLAQPAQEPYIAPSLSILKHSDNCRYWDDGEYCTCGAVEYHELKYWKSKALAEQPAQPKQEPEEHRLLRRKWFGHRDTGHLSFTEAVDVTMEKIYAQLEQEPVATVIKSDAHRTWMSEALGQLPDGTYSLYTTPPAQREWVELTDDDLVACSEAQKATVIYFLAKLKKLNT